MHKPDTCETCPFFADGEGFVPDTIVDRAEVAIVDGTPSAEDVKNEEAWSGYGSRDVEKRFFGRAGLERGAVSVMHVIRCRGPMSRPTIVADAAQHCRVHDVRMSDVRLVVYVGDVALRYAGGIDGTCEDWRGRVIDIS